MGLIWVRGCLTREGWETCKIWGNIVLGRGNNSKGPEKGSAEIKKEKNE